MPNLIFLKGNIILKNQDTFTYKNHHENTNLAIFVTAAVLHLKKLHNFYEKLVTFRQKSSYFSRPKIDTPQLKSC